jgi:hypothetical protein
MKHYQLGKSNSLRPQKLKDVGNIDGKESEIEVWINGGRNRAGGSDWTVVIWHSSINIRVKFLTPRDSCCLRVLNTQEPSQKCNRGSFR